MKTNLALFITVFLLLSGTSCTKKKAKTTTQYSRALKELLSVSKDQSFSIDARGDSINKAIKLTNKKPWDSLGLAILYQKGLLHFQQQQNDSFFLSNKLLYKKSEGISNQLFTGKSAFNLGYFFDELINQPDSAFHYYTISKNVFLKLGDSIQAGRKLLNIATIQKNQNDFFGAKETLNNAIVLLDTGEDKKFLASAYNELATNHKKLLNYDDAIYYYLKAIETATSIANIIIYKNNLSQSYSEVGKYSRAISILKNVIADSILKSNPIEYARVLHNLTYSEWKNRKTKVETDFLRALHIRKERSDYRGLVSSYTNLGEFYSKKEPVKAKRYLDTLMVVAKKIKMLEGEVNALKQFMKLEPNNIGYKDRYIFLKDSLYQQELKVKTQFAKMKYDDEQEKVELQDLRIETAEKKVDLAEQKNHKLLFLALSGFLVILGLALAYIYRQRHKKEKLQEVLNTEKRISKTVHDVLANDIYGVMAALETNAGASTKKIIDRLDAIYQRTRDISHDTKGLAHGKDFEEELKDMIAAFNGENTTIVITGLQEVSWEKLNENTCVAIYRTVKELLVNEKKYAEATFVALNFKQEKKRLHIHYKDNGIGCEPDQKFGVGLTNTGSRIQSLGGVFTFEPQKGKGLAVKVSLPV